MYAAHASSYHHPIITYHKRRQAKPSQAKVRQGCPLMVMAMVMVLVLVVVVVVLAWLLLLG